jgi:hypothetical protein
VNPRNSKLKTYPIRTTTFKIAFLRLFPRV